MSSRPPPIPRRTSAAGSARTTSIFLTDVHVKHAQLLADKSLTESAANSVALGSNGLIVTGDWTGHPPAVADLKQAREAAAGVPVIVGSGLNAANASELLRHADGAIVGTSIKTGDAVDPQKATELVTVLERLRSGR